MKLGTHDIIPKLGSSPVLKMYLGSNLVWIPPTVGYDNDAQAGFTAAGITDSTQKTAANNLILALKAAGIWTKLKALYLMVGGNATAHAVNWKSPGTFNLTFFGSPTHSSSGVDWNGTTQYAKTGLIPVDALGQFSNHLAYYSTENTSDGVGDIGCFSNSDTRRFTVLIRASDTVFYESGSTVVSAANLNSQGFYVVSRESNVALSGYKNSSLLASSSTTETSPLPTTEVTIGTLNYNNDFVDVTSNRNCALASIGDGLTSTEVSAYTTAVQNYQTALGRAV